MKKLLMVLPALLILVGCATENSDLVDQNRIRQAYIVSYDEDRDVTSATAYFKFGSTDLSLKKGSSVTNDTIPLKEKNVLGTLYTGEVQGFSAHQTFTFVDTQKKTYVNSISIVPVQFNRNAPAVWKRSDPLTIVWDGTPLAKEEYVTLSIRNEQQQKVFDQTVRNEGAKAVVVDANELQKFATGMVSFQLTREKSIKAQQATAAGGDLNSRYFSKKRFVVFQ